MSIKKLLTTPILIAVVLLGGCKDDKFSEVVGVCPVVTATNPANLATSVALNQIITVTFNEEMNPSTITSSSVSILNGTNVVAGTLSYNGLVATFTPTNNLASNTTYIGRVKTSVKDLKGNALQADYVWTFSTGTVVSPLVIATDPVNNATGVLLNKIITAKFSMPMNSSTITDSTFTLKQGSTLIAGTVSYIDSTASFTPTVALSPNTVYTATIKTGAKNVAGNPLLSNYVWTFTTGTLTAPTVILTDPLNNATGVALTKIITATFSVPMDAATLTASTFTVKNGTTSVAGTISYSGSMVTFTPTANLLSDATYTVTITTGAKNVAGTPLVSNYVWTFSTVAHLGPIAPDLKSVARFGIIAYSTVTNNAGPSVINNLDVGIYPGTAVTGFPPATVVNGAIYTSTDAAPVPAMLIQAKQDLTDAYLYAEGATAPAPATVSGDLSGLTLAPGIWKSTSSLAINGSSLTLDAQGDVNAVWIFQIASTLITTTGGSVVLANGAQAKNVYWQVGSSATIGDYTSFYGNVLALTSITMNSNSTATGRMLVQNGAVVLTSTNIINKP
ncbi:MAG: Ig-like domain-containing protein [Paludibacteraceae bacterium]|nr:Ig-like domain-containing protein [Paludibacteraceae bacterium]